MPAKHSIALTAIAAALSLSAPMESAHAAVIGSFDPGFPFSAGAGTNNLGFRGTITLDLSSGCAGASGYIVTSSSQPSYSGCSITPVGATVDYYNATLHSSPTPADILVATTLSATTFPTNYIVDAYFDPVSGNLLAFDSTFSNNIYVSVTDNSGVAADQVHYNEGATPGQPSTYTDNLNLYFQSGYVCTDVSCGYGGYGGYPSFAPALFTSSTSFTGPGNTGPTGTVDPTAYMADTNANNVFPITSFAATVTISSNAAVPEPESAALALIGLGALAAARRRKSTKPERRDAASPPPD